MNISPSFTTAFFFLGQVTSKCYGENSESLRDILNELLESVVENKAFDLELFDMLPVGACLP